MGKHIAQRRKDTGNASSVQYLSHHLWIEGPEVLNRLNRYLKLVVVASLSYGLGAILAFFGKILDLYAASPAFVIGALGIGWVVTSIPSRARNVDFVYSRIVPIFRTTANEINSEYRRRFAIICDPRRHLISSILILLFLLMALYIAFFSFPLVIFNVKLTSLRPMWFAPEIYERFGGWPGFITIGVFCIEISASLGTALWLMFEEMNILRYLCTLAVPPLPEAVRMNLRPIADLHVRIALDWSAGAILFVFLFVANADPASITFVIIVISVAAYEFLFPQIQLKKVVMKAHKRAVEIAVNYWNRSATDNMSVRECSDLLGNLTSISASPGYWVYGSGQVVMWIIAQSTAMGVLVVQILQSAAH